jgi:hypothetical protein
MSPRRLVGLYPAPWRRRYGDEFLALLEERPPTGAQVLDIAWSAIDAHLFPQAPEGRFRMFTRIAGIAALGAGLALLIGFMGWLIPNVNEYTVPAFSTLAIIGLVGVHLRQVAVRPVLAWFGFVAALFGLAMAIASIALGLAGELPPLGGEFAYLGGVALFIGSAVLGAVMLAIAVFPMPVGLAFTIGAPLAMIGLLIGAGAAAPEALSFVSQAGIVLYAVGWLGAGLSLLIAQPREGVLSQSN